MQFIISVYRGADKPVRFAIAGVFGLFWGFIVLFCMLSTMAAAQEDTDTPVFEVEVQDMQAAQVKALQVETKQLVMDLGAMKAFIGDEELVKAGHAPPGWKQPPLECYEATLGSRPSLLPLEAFLKAVEAGLRPVEEAEAYVSWVEAQALLGPVGLTLVPEDSTPEP